MYTDLLSVRTVSHTRGNGNALVQHARTSTFHTTCSNLVVA